MTLETKDVTHPDPQRSYERFVEITTPLLLQHYERIRDASESDEHARGILKSYGKLYQTFDVSVANDLHNSVVAWLTKN